LKENRITRETRYQYAATKALCDDFGEPVLWTFKTLTPEEVGKIQDACTNQTPDPTKPRKMITKVSTSKFINQLIIQSTVEPDLMNTELQDSYGVKNEQDLLYALIDNPGEYDDLADFVQRVNGYEPMLEKQGQEVKN
jgi:hypothetical protein